MCYKNYFILFLFLIIAFSSKAQLNAGTFGKVNIASPNAAALGKFGDIPVNYHTGIPNISIPIFTLKEGELSLAIQLSYHASGLRVDENASWVGAGWSLIAGGAITRTVKDKPDERRTENLQQLYGHFSNYGISSYILNQDANSSAIDQEPDIFSFSFNGFNGKFFFDDSRRPIILPEQDVKIEYVYKDELWIGAPGLPVGVGKSIEKFVLTTSDGTKYYFGIPNDQSVIAPYCDPIEVVSSYSTAIGNSPGKVISSWYLYKVVSSDGVNQINLQYKRDKYAFFSYPSSVYGKSSQNTNTYYGVKNLMAGVVLANISTSSNKVEFLPGIAREDISRWSSFIDEGFTDYINESSPTLGSIKIYDTSNFCIKKFNFTYGYFEDNSTPTSNYFNWIVNDKKRLKLNTVQEVSGNELITISPYSFEYFTGLVPRRMSFGKDHWGYINGANSNAMLYPAIYDNFGRLNERNGLPISNREAQWPAMQAGTLKKITYPTGGSTIFDFEPNSTYLNGLNRMVGGLRIKAITSNDPITNNINKTSFDYSKQGTVNSSGILFSIPTYIQLIRNDEIKKLNPLSTNGKGCFTREADNASVYREFILSDNSVRPMESTQGYHIGYSSVKVSKLSNGYSVYVYNVKPPMQIISGDGLTNNKINNPGPCDLNIPNYPSAPLPFDPYRGELLTESHYDESGVLLSQKEYQTLYQQKNVSTPGRVVHIFDYVTAGFNSAITYYGLKTAKKIESTIVEKSFESNGNFVQSISKTLFESSFHNAPTKLITYNSSGDTIIKKNIYAFDFRSTAFDNQVDCNNGSSDFLSYIENIYNNYSNSFLTNTNPNNFFALLSNFSQDVFGPRKVYIDCNINTYSRQNPVNLFQQSHDVIKASADQNLKPILWMQDLNRNALIETSEWKNSKLVSSLFMQYTNERDDEYGIYPVKLKKIELASLSNQLSPLSISANNKSIAIDNRYSDLTSINYYKGKPTNQISRDGINVSYDWNYNYQSPIVKILNAYNLQRESSQVQIVNQISKFNLGSSFSKSGFSTFQFTQVDTSNITFTLSQVPPGAKVNALYTLNGPGQNNAQYNLCIVGQPTLGNSSCNNTPSTITLPKMLPGTYSLTISVNTNFDSYQFLCNAIFSYLGKSIITVGAKEYFYQGFEDEINVNTTSSYTGIKSFTGDYTVSFVPPNTRSYILQYWNFANGKWNFNQQNYSGPQTLSGTLDEIRVFPSDAQMTTYTYDSRFGLRSICDMNNRINSYEYDRIGRLKLIRDHDGNIIKSFDYQYQTNQ
jgi:hypothetical protein